jgi:spermidine/putrescine transport system permease protein
LWIYFWFYLGLLFTPLIVLAAFSLHDSELLALPWQGFSLRWYREMLHSEALLRSLRVSIVVALVSSTLAVALGGALGIAVSRFRFPGRGVLTVLALSPLVIPYLGLAVSLLMTFVALGLKPSIGTVVVGHTVVAIPYALLLVATRLLGVDPELEEAALDLGAGWRSILGRLYIPLMGPAIGTAFVTTFILSFDELYLAFFLSGSDQTLPVYFFSGLRHPEFLPPTLALTTLVTVLVVAITLSSQVVSLRRRAPA